MMLQVPNSCSFFAHRNGTNQTGMSSGAWTQVLFTTIPLNVGSKFASSAWTPPAGKVSMVASVACGVAVTSNSANYVGIYKDGAIFRWNQVIQGIGNYAQMQVSIDDVASGTSIYTMYAVVTGGSGRAFLGDATLTYFSGHWFSP